MNRIDAILTNLEAGGRIGYADARLLRSTIESMTISPDDASHLLGNKDGVRYCRDARCQTGAENTPCSRIRAVLEPVAALSR